MMEAKPTLEQRLQIKEAQLSLAQQRIIVLEDIIRLERERADAAEEKVASLSLELSDMALQEMTLRGKLEEATQKRGYK